MTITTEPSPPADGAPDAPSASPRPRRRRIIAVVVLAALAAGGWWVFIRDDGSGSGRLPSAASGSVGTIPPVAKAAPDAEAASLQGLLVKGRGLTFHARYKASGDPELLGGDLTIEVWRKGGQIRQDTTVTRANNTVRSAGFVLGDETTTCSKRGDEPWACTSAPDPGTTEDGVFGSVAAELQGADVSVTDETVAGREARCFSFETGDGTGKLCLTSDGLPLSLEANGQKLELVDVEPKVDGAVFEPPATS